MNLTNERLEQLSKSALSPDEHALLRCQFAAELIHTGQYEAAREALGELWRGIGERPIVKGLATSTAAEVLLQCGTLSGWLGSLHQAANAQEKAKDLLSESLRGFQAQREKSKVSEAQYELGLCYFRLGAYDEARVVLDEAAKGLNGSEEEQLKAKVLSRRASVEIWTGRYHDALRVLEEAQAFFEGGGDAIRGRWHGHKGLALKRLAIAESRTDYADRSIIEFTAAAHYFEQANHQSYRARALNNLAMLLYRFGRPAEAHENLDRAAAIFISLKDECSLAQVNETRARVLVAESRYREANRIIADVIRTFEKGGEHALLTDALTIQGVVWSHLGDTENSIQILRHAMNLALDSGTSSNAGLAALTLIEEHGKTGLSESELYTLYRRADEFLKETQDAEDIARLRACARIVARRLFALRTAPGEEGFLLPRELEAYEALFIGEALEAENGSITRAAKRLGISYQWLAQIINKRHKHLLNKRTPAIPRGRSLMSVRVPRKASRLDSSKTTIILLVEENRTVADAVKVTLTSKGWSVESCTNGVTALMKIASNTHYDLLLIDNELQGINGLELVQLARKLPHQRRTPIIMLSASDCETEAWKAGVNAFLRKSQDISSLVGMVIRLLSDRE